MDFNTIAALVFSKNFIIESTLFVRIGVLLVGAAPTSGGSWHHGVSYGIAVDESASEVVYWADDW